MTMQDFYDTLVGLAILGLPFVLAAWYLEHREGLRRAWAEYRQRNRDLRAAEMRSHRQMIQSGRLDVDRVLTSHDVARLRRRWDNTPVWQADPSPTPRRTR